MPQSFTQSYDCLSGAHCATCRNREGGRRWRLALSNVGLTIPMADFECPHGKPWGFDGPAAAVTSAPMPDAPPLLTPMTLSKVAQGVAGLARAIVAPADADLVKSRSEICAGCEHGTVSLGVVQTCGLCGCTLWGKVRDPAAKCPAGKW